MYQEKAPLFDIPLLSPQLGSKYFEKFFLPTLKNQSIFLQTSAGMGDYSHLAYLSRQTHLFPEFKQNLFMLLDLETFILDENLSLEEAFSSLKSTFLSRSSQDVAWGATSNIFDIIFTLILKNDYRLCIMVDNFQALLDPKIDLSKRQCGIELLESFRKIAPNKLSFIFINQVQLPERLDISLGHFELYVRGEIEYKKDLIFDNESFDIGVKNRSTWWGIDFDIKFVEKLKMLGLNDPSVLRLMLEVYRSSPSNTLETFIKAPSDDLSTIYELCAGPLDNRYGKIFSYLQPTTQENLILGKSDTYLENVGVTVAGEPFTKLFGYYLQQKRYKNQLIGNPAFGDLLTPMEAQIYKMLTSYKGELVTKDDVAIAIWGDKWVENYNIAALDKHVSNLRKKLLQAGKSEKIQTLRNQGYILV